MPTHLFLFCVDRENLHIISKEFAAELEVEDIPAKARLINRGMPEYAYDIFQNRSAFPKSQHHVVNSDFGTYVSYDQVHCPNAEKVFDQVINLKINEFYTEKDIDEMGQAVEKVADYNFKKDTLWKF